MKRILNICCVCMMIITMSINVYAEPVPTPTEVTPPVAPVAPPVDADIQKAVDIIMGLSIASGKEDGLFHQEQNITREEFIKMIVMFMGASNEVNFLGMDSDFEDVEAGRWSIPYIKFASSNQIVKGYDGLFRPSDNINMNEALTILLRAMGYKDRYLHTGEWPMNYMLKASEIGILDNVKIQDYSLPLTRGNVALIMYNALDSRYIDNVSSQMSKCDYLIGKLKIRKLESMKFVTQNYDKYVFCEEDSSDEVEFKSKKDLDIMQGMSYEIYVNKDNYILFAKRDVDVKGAHEMAYITNGYDDRPSKKIKISGEDDYITIDSNTKVYVNGTLIGDDDYDEYLNENAIGNFVLDGNDLEQANIVNFEYRDIVVREVDATNKVLKGIVSADAADISLDFKNYDGYSMYLIENNTAKPFDFASLTKDYVVSISEKFENNDDKRVVYVYKGLESGKFQRLYGGTNHKNIYFTMENNQNNNYIADYISYKYNPTKEVELMKNKQGESRAILEEFYNEQVSVYKNILGKVIYIEGNFNSKSNLYGILLKFGDEIRGEIQILTKDNSKTVYAFDDADEYDRLKEKASVGCVIRYSIGKSGKLKNMNANIEQDIFDLSREGFIEVGDDFGFEDITISDKKYNIDSDSAYFDYTHDRVDSHTAIKWDRLKGKKVIKDIRVSYFVDSNQKLKFLVIKDNIDGIKDECLGGYVSSLYSLGDKRYISICNSKGETHDYLLDDKFKNISLVDSVVPYKINNDNKLYVSKDEDVCFVYGRVEDKDGKNVRVHGEYYFVNGSDKIYKNKKAMSMSALKKNDFVSMYVKDNEVMILSVIDFGSDDIHSSGVIKNADFDMISVDVDGESVDFYINEDTKFLNDDGYLESALKLDGANVDFAYDKDTMDIIVMVVK